MTKVAKKENTYHWLKPTQWKKGQSGNPKGRTPGHKYSLRAVLQQALHNHGYKPAIQKLRDLGVDVEDGTHGDLINAILLWKAENGDMEAIKEVYRQTERPLAREFDPDDLDPDGNTINVTMNIVKTTNNIQNNKIVNVKPKPKKIKLKR